ncbi:hypothetical protein IC006_2419 [Sulfuracidifex tepidarius]|uniref:Uncharacterized protein n=1 Tax=Sulfuracidifex tepidarius TaxID=1294262 RepID=A0A510DXY7_9CREN|nr:hypothetical protein IC006_2419 [Sulfuracidifex tepidarius]
MVSTFKNVSATTLNSEKIYYFYANDKTYAEFVDVIGDHIVVVINYSNENGRNDILSYYKSQVPILLQLTYNVNNYMSHADSLSTQFLHLI